MGTPILNPSWAIADTGGITASKTSKQLLNRHFFDRTEGVSCIGFILIQFAICKPESMLYEKKSPIGSISALAGRLSNPGQTGNRWQPVPFHAKLKKLCVLPHTFSPEPVWVTLAGRADEECNSRTMGALQHSHREMA